MVCIEKVNFLLNNPETLKGCLIYVLKFKDCNHYKIEADETNEKKRNAIWIWTSHFMKSDKISVIHQTHRVSEVAAAILTCRGPGGILTYVDHKQDGEHVHLAARQFCAEKRIPIKVPGAHCFTSVKLMFDTDTIMHRAVCAWISVITTRSRADSSIVLQSSQCIKNQR